MKGATLFSGIGVPELAAPGIDWLWCAETDDFASAVLKTRFGHPNLGDVSAPDFVEKALAIGRPDILVFGSPCQSFSVAGKRLGLDDARGNLALVALGVARQLRPRWLVFENVPGLFSSFSGSEQAARAVHEGKIGTERESDEDRDFAAFLTAVRECGYTGCWRVLDAQYFRVPQRRRRVFFVGYSGTDWRRAAAVLFEPESLSGRSPPRREPGQDIAPTLSARTQGGGGLGTDFDLDGGLVAFDCKAGGNTGFAIGDLPTALRGDGHAGGHAAIAFDTTQITSPGNYSNPKPGDPVHPLAAQAHPPTIAIQERAISENPNAGPDGKGWQEDIAFTLEARSTPQAVAFNLRGRDGGAMPEADEIVSLRAANGGSSRSYIAQDYAVRRLTPLECERAQGLPDNWTNIPWKGKNYAPDSRRYKAIGNAMARWPVRWILDRVQLADNLMEAA